MRIFRSKMKLLFVFIISTLILIQINQLVAFQSQWRTHSVAKGALRAQNPIDTDVLTNANTKERDFASKLFSNQFVNLDNEIEEKFSMEENSSDENVLRSRRDFFSTVVSSSASVAAGAILLDSGLPSLANATELDEAMESLNALPTNTIAASGTQAIDLEEILKKASRRALGGGKSRCLCCFLSSIDFNVASYLHELPISIRRNIENLSFNTL